MLIRSVSADESELLSTIHRECFPHYWNPEAFTDFFSVEGTHALVVEADAPQAMIVYRISYEQADIITIAVRPPFRRQGIASLLMTEATKTMGINGVKQLFLDVEDGNIPAIKLYEGFGFKHINRRRLYYRQKDGSFTDALVMSNQLSVASGQRPV